MINKQIQLVCRFRYRVNFVLTFLLMATFSPSYSMAQSEGVQWEPAPREEYVSIWHDQPLSDIEIVRQLTRHLDKRISMSRLINTTPLNPNPPAEYSLLIALIADRPYPADPKGRPETIEMVMKSLPSVENESEVRSYLNLALGIARGNPSEKELLSVVSDPDTPEITLAVALQAMSRSRQVPIRALPRLLELSDHPMSSISADSCMPPHNVQRKFAIRDLVLECLTRLEVKAERVLVEDGTIDHASGKPLPETRIKVDRSSLVERLHVWLRDDDAKVWRAAMDAAADIPGDDLVQLINDLRSDATLGPEKLRYLRDLRREP